MFDDKETEELLELIKKIAVRPVMYAGEYDFGKAAAFIDGFMYAREYAGDTGKSDMHWDFGRWLAEKLDRPRNWGWPAVMKDAYKEDEKAFEMLPKHFEEFLKTR